jgi:2-octaprenyl-6-methoxyphenol hydroxylase
MKNKFDFIISGAGFISLILCLILKKNNKSFVVFDKILFEESMKDDKKTFAISKYSFNLLKNLDVFDEDDIKNILSPINNIYIYDEYSEIINYDFCIFEAKNNEPMGFMIDSYILKNKLLKKIGKENILWGQSYDDFEIINNEVKNINKITLKNINNDEKNEIFGDFFFISEGKNSQFYKKIDSIKSFEFDYSQTALLFKIKHSLDHNFSALEKFFEEGMIATLPLKNQNESSIVWIIKNQYLNDLESLDKKDFLKILKKKIDYNLGEIDFLDNLEKIAKYKLKLKFLSKVSYKNIFFIGDSAHAIHPVAGQGLNLSISDLSRILKSLNIDIFINEKIDQNHCLLYVNKIFNKFIKNDNRYFFNIYSMFFNLQMISFTHYLNRLFLNKNIILKYLRNKSIGFFGFSKILNSFLKKNATGEK